MPAFIRAQVVIPRDSNVPADNSVNVLHFATPGLDLEAETAAIHARLTTFYQAIDAYLSSNNSSTATVKYYDLTDPEPRAPIDQADIALTNGTGASYPAEVAICLSFQGAMVSGEAQSRRRGRLYLGPLDGDASSGDGIDERVNSSVRTALCNAMETLATLGVDSVEWSVFSPTNAGPAPWDESALSSAFTIVTNGWVDNAFDVQRRRGAAASARTLWSL